MRFLLLILFIPIVWLFFELIFKIGTVLFLLRRFSLSEVIKILLSKHQCQQSNTNTNNNGNQKMVQCTKCQLYVPENKAYHYHGNFYCCEEHAN
jgi:hypothetical protein